MLTVKEYNPWETQLKSCSVENLAKFLKAIIITESHITSLLRFPLGSFSSKNTVYFCVTIPIDREEIFEQISECKLKKMSRLQVGFESYGFSDYKGKFAEKL